MALQAIYTLAFLCLLRADEVLKIQFEHISFSKEDGLSCIKLTLPFRKTHQFGGEQESPSLFESIPLTFPSTAEIKLFVLWELNAAEAHLCPVRALAEYINPSKITLGYVFQAFTSQDRLVANNTPMISPLWRPCAHAS